MDEKRRLLNLPHMTGTSGPAQNMTPGTNVLHGLNATTPLSISEKRQQVFQNMGQEGNRRSVEQNLDFLQGIRAKNPVQSPVAAGTPTQRRLEADESARQFEESMSFNREKFQADERYRAAQLALARQAAARQAAARQAAEASKLSDRDRMAALQAGAMELVDTLKNTGQRVSAGGSRDAGAVPLGYRYEKGMSPEQVAQAAVSQLLTPENVSAARLNPNEIETLIDTIYQRAGVSRKEEKQPTSKQMLDEQIYGGQAQYLDQLRMSDPQAYNDMIRRITEEKYGLLGSGVDGLFD